jgi:predicted acyltransferase
VTLVAEPTSRTLPIASEASPTAPPSVARARWLDAMRGFTMICLISHGFGFPRLANEAWAKPIARQFDHVEWTGMTAWDLVQPFFMFIVGAAMPFAFAARRARGGTWANGWPHVLWRAGMLLLLSHIAMIGTGSQWGWQLINVLSQIAFTYVIAYCVLDLRWTAQLSVAFGLLLAHYLMHVYGAGVGPSGVWAKDSNVGAAIDRAILGRNWSGGYATLNFMTSATATIAGVMAANVLRSTVLPTRRKFLVIGGAAVALIVLGVAISPWVPVIKRIWTPSFAMVSVGCTLIALLAFYAIDLAWPRAPWGILIAVGANCIFLYMISVMLAGRLRDIVIRLLGPLPEWLAGRFHTAREPWLGFTADWLVLALLVGLAVWMHRRRILIKI